MKIEKNAKDLDMTEAILDAGICGFKTTIQVDSEDQQTAKINLESGCPHIMKMAEEISTIDAYSECFGKPGNGSIYSAAAEHCAHAACPIAPAIIKAVEVECNLALPKQVSLSIEKKD